MLSFLNESVADMPREGNEGKESKGGDDDVDVTGADEIDAWLAELPGGGDSNSILDRAAAWFGIEKKKGSARFNVLESFLKNNCDIFRDAERDPLDTGDGTGISLEFYDCHRRYLQVFEEQLTWFIEQEGSSMEEFYGECEKAMQGKSLTIFENESLEWFVDALLSSMEYGKFHTMMWKRVQKKYGYQGGSKKRNRK